MKVLVVLALVIFSVCNADIPSQEAPKSNLEVVKNAFWDYFIETTLATAELVKEFSKTELGQDVNARITQSASSVNEYIASLRSQDFMSQLTQEAEKLKACLEKGLTAVGTTMQPVAEDLVAKLQTQVDAMIPKTKSLQTQVAGKTQEIWQKLAPYGDDMRSKLNRIPFHGGIVSKASTHQLFLPSLLIVYLMK